MISPYWRAKQPTLLTIASFLLFFTSPGWADEKKTEAGNTAVSEGKKVSLEYTLTLDDEDKTKIDSNIGKAPLVYTQGAHEIIPGLEKQLNGLKVGESRRIEVTPEEAYGKVDPARTQEVPKEKIPQEAQKVGARLTGQAPDGQPIFAQVTEVKDETVILDMNHPLAGKKLIFDVKVLKVEDGEANKVELPPASATP